MTDIYNTTKGDFIFFLFSFLAGVALAVFYDLIRISRRVVKVGTPVVLGEDILFFMLSAPVFFAVAYLTNDGEVRIHGLFSAALGVTVYFSVVKNRFVNFGTAVLLWLIKAMLKLLQLALFPLRLIFKILKKPIDVVIWYTGRSFAGIKGRARTVRTRMELRTKALFAMIGKK